jgi:hypothetical protein
MPPSFLPAGVLDMGGRDIDGLFSEGERNPPAGTRLGMPFRGAVINQRDDYMSQYKQHRFSSAWYGIICTFFREGVSITKTFRSSDNDKQTCTAVGNKVNRNVRAVIMNE